MKTTKKDLEALCDILSKPNRTIKLGRDYFGYQVLAYKPGQPVKCLNSCLTAKECSAYLQGLYDSLTWLC